MLFRSRLYDYANTVLSEYDKLKKEIIIFKDQKPTKEEICHSIEHFCMDHSIDCICVTRRDRILYKIDGELYQTKIQEDHLDQPSYWMIICFLSR